MRIQRKAIEHYGIRNQLRMLQEECGEVVVVVNHLLRDRVRVEDLINELVDIEIMLDQMRAWYADDECWDMAKKKKLIRLQDRMKENGNGE